jgi:hypothetical protein
VLNFPEVGSWQEAEFFTLEVRMVIRGQERENRRAFLHLRTHQSNKVAKARFLREHSKVVHAEMKFYATRDV